MLSHAALEFFVKLRSFIVLCGPTPSHQVSDLQSDPTLSAAKPQEDIFHESTLGATGRQPPEPPASRLRNSRRGGDERQPH